MAVNVVREILSKDKQKPLLEQESDEKEKDSDFYSFIKECLTNKNLEVPAEKGKGDIQIEQAIGFLLSETSPFKLIDYGCGKGRLLEGLKTLDDVSKKNITYVGVNKEYPHEAERIANSYGINGKFYTTDKYEALNIKAKYIFLINVLHEITLKELPARLYHIFKSLETEGWFFIHDVLELTRGENNFVTWEAEDIVQLFDSSCFELKTRPYHLSRKDIALTTIAALKRRSTTVSLNDLAIKCNDIYRHKKDTVIKKIDDIHKLQPKPNSEIKRFGYLNILYANIDRQIRDSEAKNNEIESPLISENIHNPYDFEHPAIGEHFYGRKTELKRLKDALLENRSVAIYGLQRIGKTSLVDNILDNEIAKSPENIVIKIDMFAVSESCLSYIDFLMKK
ncbi:MAG: methyltransferase domain-containing protein [Nitrospinota bacterium]